MTFDKNTISTMRAVLDEAAKALNVTPATQAKMAQEVVLKAANGASRDELKAIAMQAGKTPAA
jgi:hypothetical protein